MFIQTEATPNPEVLKFLPGRELLPGGSREFADPAEAAASPLARALFGLRRRHAGLLRRRLPDRHQGPRPATGRT